MNYKRIYVCSPLRAADWPGILRNANKAQQYIEIAAEKYKCRAVAPHAYLPLMLDDNEPDERALAIDFGKKLLELCDMLVVCGNIISEGMCGEIQYADKLGIPVQTLKKSARMTAEIQAAIKESSL